MVFGGARLLRLGCIFASLEHAALLSCAPLDICGTLLSGLVWRPVLNPYIVYTAICSTYSILLLRLCLSATCRFAYKVIQWPMLPLAGAAIAFRLGNLSPDQEFWTLLVSYNSSNAA